MPKKKPSSAAAPRKPTAEPATSKATKAAPTTKTRKGDGVRTAQQRDAYPHGRTRMLQLVASNPLQKQILDYITGHHRNERHGLIWRLLEAGCTALFGTTPPPTPTDCGTRRTKPTAATTPSHLPMEDPTSTPNATPPPS